MSETTRQERPGISFVEIYFFLRLLFRVVVLGLAVIVLSEWYLSSSDKPRPVWLGALESVYSSAWNVTLFVVTKLFDTKVSETSQLASPTATYPIARHDAFIKANNTKAFLLTDVSNFTLNKEPVLLMENTKVSILGQKEFSENGKLVEFCLISYASDNKQPNYAVTLVFTFTDPEACLTEPSRGGVEKKPDGSQMSQLNPVCAVEVVRTDEKHSVVEKKQFNVKDLSDLTGNGTTQGEWQKVNSPDGERWTSRASLNEKRKLPECRA